MGQTCVRQHENAGQSPDIWAVSYYAATIEPHAVTPEISGGNPAASVTGMAYWLIQHLSGQLAAIDVNAVPGLVAAKDRMEGKTTFHQTTLTMGSGETTKTITYDISNKDEHIEYCPVLSAKISNPGNQFRFRVNVGGRDFTKEVVKDGGLVFVNALRLMPKDKQKMTLTIERNASINTVATMEIAAVTFTLFAHPTAMDRKVQVSELDINTADPLTVASLNQ